jgi:hypothetical protein
MKSGICDFGSVRRGLKLVIASAAKQSIDQEKERMDCFVASLLAMTPMQFA